MGLFDWAIGLERWQEYTDERRAKERNLRSGRKRRSPRAEQRGREVRAASAQPSGFRPRPDRRGKSRPTPEDWIRWANSNSAKAPRGTQ